MNDIEASSEQGTDSVRSVLDRAYFFATLCDLRGTVLQVIAAGNKCLLPSSLIGSAIHEAPWFSHSADVSFQIKGATQRARAGYRAELDTDLTNAEGGRVAVQLRIDPVPDSEGAVTQILISAVERVCQTRPGQQRVDHEAHAQSLFAEIHAIYHNAPVGMCVLDTEQRYVRINERMAEFNGVPVERHLSRCVADVLPELAGTLVPMIQSILDTGQPVHSKLVSGVTPARPGIERHWLCNCLPIRDPAGKVAGINLVAEELAEPVGDEHHMAQALRESEEQREHAIEANKCKSQFLANLSHEIRTPLSAILGHVDLLRLHVSSEEDRQSIDMIRANGRFLSALLTDFLDLSKVEAGKLEFTYAAVALAPLVNQVLNLLRLSADKKGLTLSASFGDEIPETLLTDATRLRQVLINLVSNAIKFTANGEVGIRLSVEPTRPGQVRMEIVDTGIGIDKERLEQIFDPFVQEDYSIAERFGGSGLGLTISKQIVEQLGGTISVKPAPGGGTVFSVILPFTPALTLHDKPCNVSASHPPAVSTIESDYPRSPSCAHASDYSARAHVILLIEDHRPSAQVMARLLSRMQHQVVITYSAEQAMEQLTTLVPDMIFCDLGLPDRDGLDLVMELRKLKTLENTVFVALTGRCEAMETLRPVFDQVALKPLGLHEINMLLAEVEHGQSIH